MKNRLRKASALLICLGLLLLLGALGLCLWNLREDREAQVRAAAVTEQMVLQMAEPVPGVIPPRGGSRPVSGEESSAEPLPAEPAVMTQETAMPTIEIEGAAYIGLLSVPAASLELPVAAQWSYDQLTVGPCAFSGSYWTDDLTVIGHNYRSHFRPLLDLPIGAELTFTTVDGLVLRYLVSNRETLDPVEVERMTGETGPNDWDLSLVTCTIGGQARSVLRCVRLD